MRKQFGGADILIDNAELLGRRDVWTRCQKLARRIAGVGLGRGPRLAGLRPRRSRTGRYGLIINIRLSRASPRQPAIRPTNVSQEASVD